MTGIEKKQTQPPGYSFSYTNFETARLEDGDILHTGSMEYG